MKMRLGATVLAALAALAVNIPSASAQSELKTVMSKFDSQLYGRVKFDVAYDQVQLGGDTVSAVSAAESYKNKSTNFNPRDSRLGLAVVRNESEWKSEARIEGDFYGSTSGNTLSPRLRLGYVKVTHKASDLSITAGQDWVAIGQLHAPVFDFGAMAKGGNLIMRSPQVTVRKKLGDNLEGLVSFQHFRRSSNTDKDRMPWLLARVAYTDKAFHSALGAGWRTEELPDAMGEDESINRWVVAGEFKLNSGPVTFLAEPYIGQSIGDFGTAFNVNSTSGTPEEILTWGGFAAVTTRASDALQVSLGYGIENPDDDDVEGLELGDSTFLKNERAFVNTWYSLTKTVKVGAEVTYVSTERGDDRDGFRLLGSTIMNF